MSSKQYFDKIADRWDDMRKDFFSEEVREKAYATAGIAPGKIAADIGAGSGFMTEGLIRNGLPVIAVDQSAEMLRELAAKFKDRGKIDCRVGESEALPVDDESVDFVFANMYLHHVENPQKAVKEMARILKPSGSLVLTDLDSHRFEFLREEHNDRWMGFNRSDIRTWLSESGLLSPVVDCVGQNCRAESGCGTSASISIFVASAVKRGPK